MSNKNAKNAVNAPDVHVVAPSNMGKGLVYNETVKQYEVDARDANGVKLNPDGSVGVALSPDAGNQLELRENGLYYGTEARKDIRHLYVSNSGNDAADGTRENPIRTLGRVAELLRDAPVVYNVYLHEGHTFDAPPLLSVPHSSVYFLSYGPVTDSKYPSRTPCNLYYRGYMASDYPRPTIRFITRVYDGYYKRDMMEFGKVEFQGIRIIVNTKVTGDDGTRSGVFPGVVNVKDQMLFFGCEVVRADVGEPVSGGNTYRDDVLLRGEVLWCTSKMSGVLQNLASYYYTSTFRLVDWNAGHNKGGCGFPGYDAIVVDQAEMLNNLQNAVSKFPPNFNLMTS